MQVQLPNLLKKIDQENLKTKVTKTIMVMVLLLVFSIVNASHFRYGLITATRLSETATTVTYRFNVSLAWRLGSAPGAATFSISGGNSGSFNVSLTNVTDPSGGWTNSTGTATVTLNKSATLTRVTFTSCCKISTMVNNSDRNWDVYTVLNTNAPGSTPVSTMPAIINMPINAAAATYTVPASDPDAGSTLAFGTPSFTGNLAGQSEPPGFSINSSTGQITLNTIGKLVGQQYNALVTVTDNNNNQIMLDFIINMVGASNPPVFDYTVMPANGFVYNVIAGQNISFPIKATDNDAGSTVSLSASGLPAYITTANFSPAMPATGNPSQTIFSWTPAAAQIGTTNVLNFIATDNVGVQSTTSVTIKVVAEPAPVFISPTPLESSVRQIIPGSLHQDIIKAQSSLGSNVSIAFATIPGGATLSPGVPTAGANPGQTTLSWTPVAADFGQKNLSFQATISSIPTIFATRNYSLIVNTPPAFASTPAALTVNAGQLFSYSITITDPDIPYGDIVDIIGATLPSWLTLTPTGNGTALLQGTPTAANGGTHQVELEAEDIYHHGNPSHVEQSFSIEVITCTSPVITCPSNIITNTAAGSCGANVSFTATSTGNPAPNISFSPTSGSFFPVGSTTVTATATNSCGTSTCTFTVTVTDNQNPTFSCPANQNIDLSATCKLVVPDLITGLTGSDNCGTVTFTQSPVAGTALSSSHNGTHNIVITANDGNGNTSQCTVVLTGKDVTQPTFTCPSNQNINLNSSCQLVVPDLITGLTGNDNCGTVTFTQSPVAGTALSSSHNATHNIVITANDGNGNTSQCTVVITGKDVTQPTFTCPSNLDVNLNGSCQLVVPNLVTGLTGNDNCGTVTFTQSPVAGTALSSSHNGTHNIVITANDGNGNTSQCTVVLTGKDVTQPTFTCPSNQNINLNSSCQLVVPNLITGLTGTDNCGTVTFIQSPSAGTSLGSSHNQLHNVTITANDGNGNTSQCTVVLTGKDITPPAITCPDNITVSNDAGLCSAIVNYNMPVVTDNCVISGTPVSQTFNYSGQMVSWTVPSNVTSITMEAWGAQGKSAQPGFFGGKGARMKGTFSVTPGDQLLILVGQEGQWPGCCSGGGGGGTFVVKVDPLSPDIITSGPFSGYRVTPILIAGGGGGTRAAASANGNPGVISNYGTTGSCSLGTGGGAIKNTGLGIGGVAPCNSWGSAGGGFRGNGQNDGSWGTGGYSFLNGGIGGSNNCGSGGIFGGFGSGGSGGGCYGGGGGGGYSGGDGGLVAGGGGSYNAGTNQDNSSGIQSGNGMLTISYGSNTESAITQTAGLPTGSVFPVGTTTNTFLATDAAGNTSTCSFTVTVTDNEKPVLAAPNSIDLECSTDLPAAKTNIEDFLALAGANANDNCTAQAQLLVSHSDGPLVIGNCNGTITRTYTITDAAGNTQTVNHVFTVSDNTKPTATAPNTVDIECSSDLPAAKTNIEDFLALTGANANDNCTAQAQLLVSHSDGPLVNGNCNGTITRTYTITDACGNTTTVDQVFTVTDNTKPTATAPNTVDLECSSDLPAAKTNIEDFLTLAGANANDNCTAQAQLLVSHTDGPLVNGNCNGTITRTYTITDACGNTTTVDQVFTVTDNTKPTATAPNTVDLECSSDLPAAKTNIEDFLTLAGANANDNCTAQAQLLVSHSDGPLVNGNCNGTITRTYTITDACGNTTTVDQVFTVTDNTIPVINVCPGNGTTFIKTTNSGVCTYTVSGTEFDATGLDNCSGVTMSYSIANEHSATVVTGAGSMGGLALNFGLNTITWIATDACGNTSVSCTVNVDVDKITTTTTLTVSPTSQQYSDLVTFTASVTPYNCTGAGDMGGTVTFKIGTLVIGTAPVINGVATLTDTLIEDKLYDANLNDPMNATSGPLKPGNKTVTAYFSGYDTDYLVSDPTAPLTVTCEDADITYNGQTYFSVSPNTNAGTVVLSNYVVDRNDTPAGARGDIRNATATFWQGAVNGSVLGTANVPVGLVNPGNTQEGFVTTSFNDALSTQDISNGGKVYEVWSGLNNYYCGSSETYTPVTLGLPGQDFVTGGGYIVFGNNSAGTYAGTPGKRMNFGFVMKWNSSGKNLQGRVNVVYRRMVNGVQRIYQIKSNAINSLVVENVNDAGAPATGANIKFRRATISTKANLTDITDPLNPVSLGGNLSLIMTAWESTTITTGALDRISVQLSGSGSTGLLFSSNWSSGSTTWQTLAGGKIQVRNPSSAPAGQKTIPQELITEVQKTSLLVKAFPNPSEHQFNLVIEGNDKEEVLVTVYNINGTQVYTTKGMANRSYKFGETLISGTYMVQVRQGTEIRSIKVVKQ